MDLHTMVPQQTIPTKPNRNNETHLSVGFGMEGFNYTLKHSPLLLFLQLFYFDLTWQQWKLAYWGFFKCWRCRKSVASIGGALAEGTFFKEQDAR